MLPEGGDEGTGAVVTDFKSDARDRPAAGKMAQRVQETQLLAPFAEGESGFRLE